MKKLILLLTVACIATTLSAQKGAVSYADYELEAAKPDYAKAREKIDEDVLNEKTKDWPKTYIVKSKVYRTSYEKSKKEQSFINGAFEAILKADELDRKGDAKGKKIGKYQKDILAEMLFLRMTLMNDGVYANNELKDFDRTLEAFEKVIKLDKNPTYSKDSPGAIDTVVYFNAVAAAYTAKNYDKIVEYAPIVIETGYQKDQPYLILYDAYKNLNDTVQMIEVLKEAMFKYPENKLFLDQLVFHYVDMQNAEEGIRYMKQSLSKDPTNSKLLFILGTFYDEIGEKEKAIESYKKINELPEADKGSKIDANYNLGVVYYNIALEKMNEANAITSNEKFLAAEAVALKAFEVCVPYFETCLELDPSNKEALTALKPVYYRLTKLNEKYNDKYKAVNDKLEDL